MSRVEDRERWAVQRSSTGCGLSNRGKTNDRCRGRNGTSAQEQGKTFHHLPSASNTKVHLLAMYQKSSRASVASTCDVTPIGRKSWSNLGQMSGRKCFASAASIVAAIPNAGRSLP